MKMLLKELRKALEHADFKTHAENDASILGGVIISMRENIENALRLAGDGDRRAPESRAAGVVAPVRIEDADGHLINAEWAKQWMRYADALLAASPTRLDAGCKWSEDEDDGYWQTGCGQKWTFSAPGTPKEHGMEFCYHCGKTLQTAPTRAGPTASPPPAHPATPCK